VALGAESVPCGGSMPYRDALWPVPWSLTALTLAGLHAVQRERADRPERWSFRVVVAAMGLPASR
jgi:hypothetical protein